MKRVILTGGSDGLGAAFGKLCVENGIEVVCLSRSEPAYAAKHIPTDLAVEESILQAVEAIITSYAPFDALINCAGVHSSQPPDAISYTEIERVFKVNVMAPTYLISCLFSHLKATGADVMNVISTIGSKTGEDQCVYGSSKWAERGMGQYFQSELKKSDCRVIQFSPGGMKTAFFNKYENNTLEMANFMNVDEIAKLMLFILQMPKSIEVSDITINRK